MASRIHEAPADYVRVQELADQFDVKPSTLRSWCRRNAPDDVVEVVRADGGTALWVSPDLARRIATRHSAEPEPCDAVQRSAALHQSRQVITDPVSGSERSAMQRSAAVHDDERLLAAEKRAEALMNELAELRVALAKAEGLVEAKEDEVERWVGEMETVRKLAAEAAARSEARHEELVNRVGELERAAGFYAERLDTIVKWGWNVAKMPRWRLAIGRRVEVPEMGYSAIQDLRGARR